MPGRALLSETSGICTSPKNAATSRSPSRSTGMPTCRERRVSFLNWPPIAAWTGPAGSANSSPFAISPADQRAESVSTRTGGPGAGRTICWNWSLLIWL